MDGFAKRIGEEGSKTEEGHSLDKKKEKMGGFGVGGTSAGEIVQKESPASIWARGKEEKFKRLWGAGFRFVSSTKCSDKKQQVWRDGPPWGGNRKCGRKHHLLAASRAPWNLPEVNYLQMGPGQPQ